MKVIYHIDAMEAWTMTLGNVRNMLDGLHQNQESYEIEVLANGPAVRGYLPGILPDSLNVVMAQAKAEGVVFAACRNALRAQALARADAFPRLLLGRPLLDAPEDVPALARAVAQAYPAQPGESLLLLGHGTDGPAAAVYPALQAALRALSREDAFDGGGRRCAGGPAARAAPRASRAPCAPAAGRRGARAQGHGRGRPRQLEEPPCRRGALRPLHAAGARLPPRRAGALRAAPARAAGGGP